MKWPWAKKTTESAAPEQEEVWPIEDVPPPVNAKDRDDDPPHPRAAALAEYARLVAEHDAIIDRTSVMKAA